jgi:hypothetical protein
MELRQIQILSQSFFSWSEENFIELNIIFSPLLNLLDKFTFEPPYARMKLTQATSEFFASIRLFTFYSKAIMFIVANLFFRSLGLQQNSFAHPCKRII